LTFTQFAALSGPAARDDGATLAADHWRPPAGTIGWGAPTCRVLSDVATLDTAAAAPVISDADNFARASVWRGTMKPIEFTDTLATICGWAVARVVAPFEMRLANASR